MPVSELECANCVMLCPLGGVGVGCWVCAWACLGVVCVVRVASWIVPIPRYVMCVPMLGCGCRIVSLGVGMSGLCGCCSVYVIVPVGYGCLGVVLTWSVDVCVVLVCVCAWEILVCVCVCVCVGVCVCWVWVLVC